MASEVITAENKVLKRKNGSNASLPCDFEKSDQQKCMEEITDLIWNEIPKSEYVSLLNDYVESEFFLIDGDSLFIMCAQDLTLQEGQNLHFFYLVERFLLDLTSKGAKYKIVFFKDAEYLYFRNPNLLSLRIALIIHLRNSTEIPIHTEFPTCLDHKWNNFLQHNAPYFLIISDEGVDQQQTNFLHIFIIHTLSKRINVVLTSGQTSDAIRVYGYHIHSLHKHWKFFQKHERTLSQYYKSLVEYLKESSSKMYLSLSGCSSLNSLNGKVHEKLSQLQEEIDLRYVVCVSTCSLVLEMHSKNRKKLQEVGELIRMYCLSVAFLHHLPLSQRARIRLIDMHWNKETLMLIHELKLYEFLVLEHLTTTTLWDGDFSVLPDLSDNHLWKNIAFYYAVEKCPEFDLDIGPEINRYYELLWIHITALSGYSKASHPLQITSDGFLEKRHSSKKGNDLSVSSFLS